MSSTEIFWQVRQKYFCKDERNILAPLQMYLNRGHNRGKYAVTNNTFADEDVQTNKTKKDTKSKDADEVEC